MYTVPLAYLSISVQMVSSRAEVNVTPPARPLRDRRPATLRLPSVNRRQRFPAQPSSEFATSTETWSTDEDKALVELVLFYSEPHNWPRFGQKSHFWRDIADFVQRRAGTTYK